MNRYDDIVIRWKDEILQLLHLVPLSGPHKQSSPWIQLADFRNGSRIDWIHHCGLRCVFRLIEQFEHERVRVPRIMRCDLPPNREKLIGLSGRITREGVEMMNIHDDRK